jgi:hypothetical protein
MNLGIRDSQGHDLRLEFGHRGVPKFLGDLEPGRTDRPDTRGQDGDRNCSRQGEWSPVVTGFAHRPRHGGISAGAAIRSDDDAALPTPLGSTRSGWLRHSHMVPAVALATPVPIDLSLGDQSPDEVGT